MKVQAHRSLESPLEYNQDQIKLNKITDESRLALTFLTILGIIEILCSFRLVLERKTGKVTSQSSKLGLLEKFLVNNFALSDGEDNTSMQIEEVQQI